MKTNILRLLVAGIGMLLMACVLSQSIEAQTVISLDSSPGNSMVMKIQNHDLLNKPHKFVFIFDSASITYEFDEQGDFALLTTNFTGSGSSSYEYVSSNEESSLNTDDEVGVNAFMQMEEIEEEPMELESWMLTPKKWVN